MINATEDILSDEHIDAIVCGILNAMVETATSQIGNPLTMISTMYSELLGENVLAISKRLEAVQKEWKEKIKILDDVGI